MLSSEELEVIRARSNAAANGEWEFDHETEFITRLTQKGGNTHEIIAILDVYTEEDATFIAHARTDVPALLDTIAEARAELVEHFDDIEFDYEGEPNDLDYMVELAGREVKSSHSHCDRETERANIAEHKVSQLRSRFALELAARTTPDMVEAERQANRIIELEDVAKDNQYIVETLARSLSVDLGAHCITELVHAAADMIDKLRSINGGLRKWQDLARPELEARIKELEAAQQPRPMSDAPQDGCEFVALVPIRYLSHARSFIDRLHCTVAIESDHRGQDVVIGWLPLPDQSDKTADPIDELLPMHSDVPEMWLIRQRDGDGYSWWKEHGRGLVTDVLAAGLHTEEDARHAVCGRPAVLEAVRLGDALNGLSCKGTVAELLGWLPDQSEVNK